jgi:hypothetical protein
MSGVRDTSIEAFRKARDNGTLGTYRQRLLNAMQEGQTYTRLELSVSTGIPINAVTGAVNLMVKRGLLVEGEKRRCSISGHDAHALSRPPRTAP